MKILTLVAVALLALPLASAFGEEEKPVVPAEPPKESKLEACKGRASFDYNFDMMNIEREQWDRKTSHFDAGLQKQRRHNEYVKALKACEEEKGEE